MTDLADNHPAETEGEEASTRRKLGLGWLLLACLGIITFCALLQLTRGEPTLSIAEMIDAATGDGVDTASFVVQELRAPRLVAGIVIGAALGAAGVLMQDSLRNP
ncbi:MAG: iron chelate uptake ABC transporter family permease subunit, partial [Actinomycetota bacterium]